MLVNSNYTIHNPPAFKPFNKGILKQRGNTTFNNHKSSGPSNLERSTLNMCFSVEVN